MESDPKGRGSHGAAQNFIAFWGKAWFKVATALCVDDDHVVNSVRFLQYVVSIVARKPARAEKQNGS